MHKRGNCLARRMSQDMILIEKGKLIDFVKDSVRRSSQCCEDLMCSSHYISLKSEITGREGNSEYYTSILETFGLSLEDFEFDQRGFFKD